MRRQRGSKVQHDEPKLLGSGAHDDCAVQSAHFTIPLKPQAKPTSFPPHFALAVQDEYAIKYLQRLGAHPTTDNIALVLEHLPLDACHVAAAWKSRGSLSDVVTINLCPHQARPDVRKHAAAASSQDAGGGSAADAKSSSNKSGHAASLSPRCSSSEDERAGMSFSYSSNSSGGSGSGVGRFPAMFHVGPVCMSFDDMKRQYLLPFKHGARDHVDILSTYGMKHDEPAPFVAIPALSDAAASSAATVHLLGRRATQCRIKCMAERVVAPDARVDVVQQLQQAFYRALPLAALGVRDDHGARALYDAVVDVRVTQLVQHTAQYLYLHVFVKLACTGAVDLIKQHISGGSGRACEPQKHTAVAGELERLFVAIVGTFEAIKRQLTREESGMRLLLPLVLLELRVAIETLYRMQYPVSWSVTGPTMQYILLEMNATISKVLDPDAHLNRLGVLETTCESTKILAAKRRQTPRLRDQFFQTSEALQSIFPQPLAGKCRKILALRGGASVANYPPHLEAPETNSSSRSGTSSNGSAGGGGPVTRTAVAGVSTRLALLRIVERKWLHR